MIKPRNLRTKVYLKWVAALGVLFVTTYPIIIYPMMYPQAFREIQAETRKDIDQSKIQPGNMKIWSDPFDRKKPNDQ